MQSRQGTASLLKSWQHNWLSTGEILLSVREMVCFEISIVCVTWSFSLTYSALEFQCHSVTFSLAPKIFNISPTIFF